MRWSDGVELGADGTWLCRHVHARGEDAPPTRLRVDETVELIAGHRAGRRWLRCPDCGTYWRVWPAFGVAKPAVEWNARETPAAVHRFRRAPVLDIDRVIDLVKAELPQVAVEQYTNVWPSDDGGLWWFRLPGVREDIQLESSEGCCPFIVEHSGMKSSGEAWNASTVEQAARAVVDYLRAVSNRGGVA